MQQDDLAFESHLFVKFRIPQAEKQQFWVIYKFERFISLIWSVKTVKVNGTYYLWHVLQN